MPRITVAVCTYDRYPHLERVLMALTRQTLPPDDYRIIVVDNSPDRAKAESFAARHHGLQQVLFHFEPRPGLSNARNAALALCQDPLIAFIDDDALARPDWLRNLVAAFDQIGPAAAAVGGVVELLWQGPRPSWLHDGMLTWLSALNRGPVRRELAPAEWLAGTNIAFRRSALDAVGGFSSLLGRYGNTSVLLSNEELEVANRIRAAGHRIYFEPMAIVDHLVHPERLNREWFRRRVAWQVISDAVTAALDGRSGAARADAEHGVAATLVSDLCRDTDDPEAFAKQMSDIDALMRGLLARGKFGPDGQMGA